MAGNIAMTTKSNVVYIDSGCGFNSTRLTQILAAKGLNNEVVQCTLCNTYISVPKACYLPSQQEARLLERIRVFQVTDVFQLLSLLATLGKNIAEEIDRFHSNIHVLIIDAITLFISPLLGGRQFHGTCIINNNLSALYGGGALTIIIIIIPSAGHALMSQVSMAMKELAYQHSIALLVS